MLRQPIITIMGHVDHGKTSILDAIRGTAIAAREAGGITQAIGASIIPAQTLHAVCGDLLKKLNITLAIPGLLFVDTPGHAAFVHHRKRGGDLADIAILVIDINEGLMPQTLECLDILKSCKTPFVIVANKIDLIDGWQTKQLPLVAAINAQEPRTLQKFETKLYEVVGALYEQKLEAERFDRVGDYTKQIAIIPASARTKEGISELLVVLCGLTQKYLEQNLQYDPKGPAVGTILEVKEEKGKGHTTDVIIYDGVIKTGDTIVFGSEEGPLVTKVKGLFEPEPLAEMREKKSKFKNVKEAHAATGVRISATGLDKAIPGTPLLVATPETLATSQKRITEEIKSVLIEQATEGVIVKADSLGSLEALTILLREKNIPLLRASIGPVTKKDISDAHAAGLNNPLHGAVLGFNILPTEPVEGVKIIIHDVIYRVIEDYGKWLAEQKKAVEMGGMNQLPKPCKLMLLPNYVFRQSNPAVMGVEIMAGTLKTNIPLMNSEGRQVTNVKGIQHEQENLEKAEKGKRVSVAMPNVVVGRQIKEGDILYSAVPEEHFRIFKEYKQYLTNDEKDLLKEIAEIMRRSNPVWGV